LLFFLARSECVDRNHLDLLLFVFTILALAYDSYDQS
jgi:hypothetical protein